MSKQTAKPVGEAAPAPGEDNNKHLAFLEAGVSSLSVALAANGIVKDGETYDVFDVVINTIKFASSATVEIGARDDAIKALEAAADASAKNKHDEATDESASLLATAIVAGEHALEGAETPLQAAVRILSKPPGGATDGELAAIARADKLEARVTELEGLIEDGAGRDLAGIELPPTKRADAAECGPIGQRSTSAELHSFLEEGPLELVFSDGTHEIVEFEPVTLVVADLYRHGNRLMVAQPIEIRGPRGADAVPIEIEGAALLVNGEQVDYCPLESKLTINPGDQRRFDRAFTFGAG